MGIFDWFRRKPEPADPDIALHQRFGDFVLSLERSTPQELAIVLLDVGSIRRQASIRGIDLGDPVQALPVGNTSKIANLLAVLESAEMDGGERAARVWRYTAMAVVQPALMPLSGRMWRALNAVRPIATVNLLAHFKKPGEDVDRCLDRLEPILESLSPPSGF